MCDLWRLSGRRGRRGSLNLIKCFQFLSIFPKFISIYSFSYKFVTNDSRRESLPPPPENRRFWSFLGLFRILSSLKLDSVDHFLFTFYSQYLWKSKVFPFVQFIFTDTHYQQRSSHYFFAALTHHGIWLRVLTLKIYWNKTQ